MTPKFHGENRQHLFSHWQDNREGETNLNLSSVHKTTEVDYYSVFQNDNRSEYGVSNGHVNDTKAVRVAGEGEIEDTHKSMSPIESDLHQEDIHGSVSVRPTILPHKKRNGVGKRSPPDLQRLQMIPGPESAPHPCVKLNVFETIPSERVYSSTASSHRSDGYALNSVVARARALRIARAKFKGRMNETSSRARDSQALDAVSDNQLSVMAENKALSPLESSSGFVHRNMQNVVEFAESSSGQTGVLPVSTPILKKETTPTRVDHDFGDLVNPIGAFIGSSSNHNTPRDDASGRATNFFSGEVVSFKDKIIAARNRLEERQQE